MDVTSDCSAASVRWQASGLGSAPCVDVPTATTAPASVGALGLTQSCEADDDSDDGAGSGAALTGRNVILNLRRGGVGALCRTTGGGIGGGSCTGSSGTNAKLGLLGFGGGFDGVLDGKSTGSTCAATGGAILSSGGSVCARAVGRVSGEAVGVGV